MDNRYKALLQKKADLIKEQKSLFAGDALALTDEQKQRDDALVAEINQIDGDIAREERRRAIERTVPSAKAPAFNKSERGDTWGGAFKAWLKTGDKKAFGGDEVFEKEVEGQGFEGITIQAASNATDMNIGTAADGGDTVPTGFYGQIIARQDESSLTAKLPLTKVPGQGTTVDVPVDNEADGEFVSTNEATDADLDAPAVAKKSMTLVDYTKYTDVSLMLLEDSPTSILEFLADFVGRGMAKTKNNLLLTEVASGGTSFKSFASASAIAFGEPEAIIGNNDLAPYLDEDNASAWVTRASTHQAIKTLVSTSTRLYESNVSTGRELLGYPVHYSQKAAAPAASAKSIYFGNWRMVGYRVAPDLTFLRDPFTVALKRQIRLLWNFRTVYKVLQAEAIGYGVHPSA